MIEYYDERHARVSSSASPGRMGRGWHMTQLSFGADTSATRDDGKRRRCEQPAVDRLSSLPEALLLHILSFLQLKDAIFTSFLSRRWRGLWTYTPCLEFSSGSASWRSRGGYVSPDYVDQALALHKAPKVRVFCAAVRRDKRPRKRRTRFAKRVDYWVLFALARGVEELELDAVDWGYRGYFPVPYALPDCLFTCGSLVSLRLRVRHLDPPSPTLMSSLKTLSLCQVNIDDHNLKAMLAGCPFLEHLSLHDCNPSSSLHVHVEGSNSRLKTLEICDFEIERGAGSGVFISAPTISTLILDGCLKAHFEPKDLSSVVTVSLGFCHMLYWRSGHNYHQQLSDLLHKLRHVQVLKLNMGCVQVLSVRALQSSSFSSDFSIVSMELAVGFIKVEFRGIFYALRSFTKLEFLTIDVTCENEGIWRLDGLFKYYADVGKYVMSNEETSPNMLQNLKTVHIFGLVKAISAVEESCTVEEILGKYQYGFEFIRFLLKNSPALEMLMISATEDVDKLTKKSFEVLFRFASRLLALPRASPNALVIIKDN